MSNVSERAVRHGPERNYDHWYYFSHASAWWYATRTATAAIACLLVAMFIQIDVPRWTILTVFIVSPPVRGNALRKTAARIVGTIVGCFVAVFLVALFPQDRIGFMIAFAAYIGSCAFWATLKRGFVAYGAVLAAFTCAVVNANVPTDPQGVFFTALHRGAATILGVVFALFASEIAGASDDVPGDLANRACQIARDLLGWGLQRLDPNALPAAEDAPFSARILAIDELSRNAMAARPALRWVRSWITGLPTALLSFQSGVLLAARQMRQEGAQSPELLQTRQAITSVADLLVTGMSTPISALRENSKYLVQLRNNLEQAADHDRASQLLPALSEIVSAIHFLVASIEAVLMLQSPDEMVSRNYPPPLFLPMYRRAWINLARAVVGIVVGSLIYDATAWPDAPFFLVNVCVAMVIYLQIDNPLTVNALNVVGVLVGGVVGLSVKHFLLPLSNNPLWLAISLFPVMFIATLVQMRPNLVGVTVTCIFVLLTILQLDNPQQYNMAQDLNTFVAFFAAYTFVPLVFLMIGTPKRGRERVNQFLDRMRLQLRIAERKPLTTRSRQLQWETSMYDALQQLQAEVQSPADRATAVDLLLSGRKFFPSHVPVSVPVSIEAPV